MEKFDLAVIGAGPGGYPAAIRGAQLGARVAIIEKEALGGTCLNWGCIPSKTLIASSELVYHMKHAAALGVKADGIGFDYAKMIARKDDVVAQLKQGVGGLLKANKVTLFEGVGSFVSRNRLAIAGKDGASTEIEMANTIIATGTTSAMPGFLPKSERVVDSRVFLDVTELPKSLLVLGGGIIGCELACMAAQLGCKVTVVELLEDILLPVDADVRKVVQGHMEKQLGIRVMTGQAMTDIKATKNAVSGMVGNEKVSAELMLAAVGRAPVTQGLALERAGLSTNERGYIPVDSYCQTGAATVYAIGDVTGGPQLAHAATSQGITAAENAIAKTRTKMETAVPSCIFTSPEIGGVGLTEKDAKAAGRDIHVGRYAFTFHGKSLAQADTAGFVKWVADAATGQLLGAHAVGAHATDLIAEAALAVRNEFTAEELGRTIHCHPTLGEAWMEAAHDVHGTCIHAAPKRKRA